MIIDEIKEANKEAFKAKDTNARAIYSVLINKYQMLEIDKRPSGQPVTDADMIGIIQKAIKEVAEELELNEKANRQEEVANLKTQLELMEKFMPQMMSADEIKAEIEKLEDKSIPSIMKHFKTNFAGKCDMRTVQEVAKNLA